MGAHLCDAADPSAPSVEERGYDVSIYYRGSETAFLDSRLLPLMLTVKDSVDMMCERSGGQYKVLLLVVSVADS